MPDGELEIDDITREELVERARTLIPILRNRAEEAQEIGRVPVDTIEDFDEAREMNRLAQAQIRQQSAVAMMVQAQQLSQTIHQLLNQ